MEYHYDAKARYTKSHEWVRMEGAEAVVGISDYAQHTLSDVVFVDLPEAGRQVKSGETLLVIESVKAAEDVFAPLSGTVSGRNEKLGSAPEVVNKDPFGEGWLVRIAPAAPGELDSLMDAAAYQKYVESL